MVNASKLQFVNGFAAAAACFKLVVSRRTKNFIAFHVTAWQKTSEKLEIKIVEAKFLAKIY